MGILRFKENLSLTLGGKQKVKIIHKLQGWQFNYGYIGWKAKENNKYRQVFPEGYFAIRVIDVDGVRFAEIN